MKYKPIADCGAIGGTDTSVLTVRWVYLRMPINLVGAHFL
jgi:hypothetical protein